MVDLKCSDVYRTSFTIRCTAPALLPRFPVAIAVFLLLIALPFASPGQPTNENATRFPAMGGEIFYVVDEHPVSFYKLIPVGNDRDQERLASYLASILRDANAKVLGDMTVLETILEYTYYDDNRLSYLFMSSESEDMITKEPYLSKESGDVWFNMESILADSAEFVSIWVFVRERDDDFRIVLDMGETVSLELGRYTLLPDEFKTGQPCEQTHHPFNIRACGEYYAEPFVQRLPQESETLTTVDFKSYSDSIAVQMGSMFGFRYELMDSTKEGTYTFKTICPGLPEGDGNDRFEHFEERECIYDEVDDLIWEFQRTGELIPGTWTMQIMDDNEVIFEKQFFIFLLRGTQ